MYPIRVDKPKAAISIATMVEPTGVPNRIETTIPKNAHATESAAEQRMTARKLLNSRIAERAGKITRAEMSRDPTRFMARTIITAMTTASRRL